MAMKDLEQEILDELSTQMQSEMDREILWDMLKRMGWRRVNLDRFKDNNHAVDITDWLAEHCNHAFERRGADFIFESEIDAVNFTLRWQ
jgi:hypothetical protein